MKICIFGGTPGSGKTSVIKSIIEELKDLKIHYVKFDVLDTQDDVLIGEKFDITTEKKISGDVCPDHYAALEIPKILKEQKDKDLVILETAGLCLRCSPYVKEGLAINVLNILSGKPSNYGPLLTKADIVAITKGDLISQAEREIFRKEVSEVNVNSLLIDANGLTGEGGIDIAEEIRNSEDIDGILTLKHSMPTAICGYCYGNKIIDSKKTLEQSEKGKELKTKLPNLNCGDCGYKSCNEFIRAVLNGESKKTQCPYLKID
ncbi:MAG: (Fe-S)-binding protein [Nanoarchaeota archaeon]|nr:(Fe-S)-binding protein [Nanoarchaeota archaeon]